MKVYCPTCGNRHDDEVVTCQLCGTEFDFPQMQLAVRNQIMRQAIRLWQQAGSPDAMEGFYLEKAEQIVDKEMEDKTVAFMSKMADDTATLLKQAAGFCREAAHDGQAYDWNVSAQEAMTKAMNLIDLIGSKIPSPDRPTKNKLVPNYDVKKAKKKYTRSESNEVPKLATSKSDYEFIAEQSHGRQTRPEQTRGYVWGEDKVEKEAQDTPCQTAPIDPSEAEYISASEIAQEKTESGITLSFQMPSKRK